MALIEYRRLQSGNLTENGLSEISSTPHLHVNLTLVKLCVPELPGRDVLDIHGFQNEPVQNEPVAHVSCWILDFHFNLSVVASSFSGCSSSPGRSQALVPASGLTCVTHLLLMITSGLFKISAERGSLPGHCANPGSPVLPRAHFKRCIISFVQTSLDPCLLPVPVDLVWMSVSVSEPLSWIRLCGVLCEEECGRFITRDLLLDSLEPVSTCHCMYVSHLVSAVNKSLTVCVTSLMFLVSFVFPSTSLCE